MSSKHNLHVSASIPAHISPDEIIEALHDHQTALTLQALTTGNTKAPSTDPSTLKDTYWYPPDQYPISTYHVTECITIIPGVGEWAKKYITFPSCFQDTRHGIKTRADASGVVVRAEFRVVRGGAAAEVEGEGMGVGDAEWILVEDVEVSCSWWLMPFVKGKLEQAHRDVCRKVVEKVEMQRRQTSIAQESPRGKGKTENRSPRDSEQKPSGVLFGQTHTGTEGAAEADATHSQIVEMAAPLPEKITYR
ncbi:hypothetical protein ACN47E_007381 [Coniothyrium glycines]